MIWSVRVQFNKHFLHQFYTALPVYSFSAGYVMPVDGGKGMSI